MTRTTLGKTVLRLAATLLTVAFFLPESSGAPSWDRRQHADLVTGHRHGRDGQFLAG